MMNIFEKIFGMAWLQGFAVTVTGGTVWDRTPHSRLGKTLVSEPSQLQANTVANMQLCCLKLELHFSNGDGLSDIQRFN